MSNEETPAPPMTQEPVAEPPLPPEWADLLTRLTTRHPLKKRTEHWLCLEWPDGQTVQINCLKIHGLYRLILSADLCNADVVSVRDALELASKLLLGGLVVQRGILTIRHVYTEDRFKESQLDEAIASLHGAALRMREKLVLNKDQTSTVVHTDFAD